MLVLARQESLDGLEDARRENLQLLQEMHNVGLKWVKRFQDEDASLIFRLGYHSVLESSFTFRALISKSLVYRLQICTVLRDLESLEFISKIIEIDMFNGH